MIPPSRQLRGPCGAKWHLKAGWVHVYINGVPIAGVCLRTMPRQLAVTERVHKACGQVLSMIEQFWSPRLTELVQKGGLEVWENE